MIGGPEQGKSANDESLTRDDGGSGNRHLQDATYKTIQGRQLRTTPATATVFFVCGCSCARDHRAPKESTEEPTSMTFKLQEHHKTSFVSDQQT